MGDVRVTRGESLSLALAGVALVVTGLMLTLGPWALVACGTALTVVALLIPVKERRAEPFVDAVPPER